MSLVHLDGVTDRRYNKAALEVSPMHIGVFGSGYLGTVVSACLADFGTPVTCYDADTARIMALAEGKLPFYERNLTDVIKRNIRAGRLLYSTDLESFAQRAQIIFFAQDSHQALVQEITDVAPLTSPGTVLVIMTPVPVGTATAIEDKLHDISSPRTVVSQPLFLTDGCAVEDFNWPDRIVLGAASPEPVLLLKQIYRPLVMRGVPVIVTSHETAELVRQASTAFVATKISFINEIATLCERVQADAVDLALALGLDKKIAPRCLQPGSTMGGAFVEREMEALHDLSQTAGIDLRILTAAREVNRTLCDTVVTKLAGLVNSIAGKEVGILGLSFKPHTSSVAGSTSIGIARKLASAGAKVRAYDPVALDEARRQLDPQVRCCETPYLAAHGADALVVGTGWPEFRALDFDRIRRELRQPVIVDTKNLLDATRLKTMGFKYVGMGRLGAA
jgi:UDPglucose 6-dehydrogenase